MALLPEHEMPTYQTKCTFTAGPEYQAPLTCTRAKNFGGMSLLNEAILDFEAMCHDAKEIYAPHGYSGKVEVTCNGTPFNHFIF